MRIDAYISPEEMRLIDNLQGKSRGEQDQMIYEYERKMNNGNTL